jgi:hypothetical protein
MKTIENLFKSYNITDFEMTDIHYGNCLNYGPLKTIYVSSVHFFHDQSEFNKLGYGIKYR